MKLNFWLKKVCFLSHKKHKKINSNQNHILFSETGIDSLGFFT